MIGTTASWLGLALALAPIAWGLRLLLRERRADRIPILCYHRFVARDSVRVGSPVDREMGWVCGEAEFALQLEHLASSGYTTLDLDEFLDVRAGLASRPARPIVITLDDGYRSNYEIAFPILRRFGMKATIYVAPQPDPHTRGQVAELDDFLSPAQMREMADQGISIQSHTLTHAILTELSDDEVRFELDESRRVLEAILDRPVRHFCFPRGGVDRRVRRLVAEVGYRSAVGASQGTSTGLDPFHDLPRLMIERDMTLEDFRRLLTPTHATLVRATGAVKSIARKLLGARRARRLRDLLYRETLRPIFRARGTWRLAAMGFTLCVASVVLIAWTFLAH